MNLTKLALFFFIIFISINLNSQSVEDIIADELCDCIKTKEITELEKIDLCLADIILSNEINLLKEFRVKTMDSIPQDVFIRIASKMTKQCSYLFNFVEPIKDKISNNNTLNCSELVDGNYYYLIPSYENRKVMDTTFVNINNHSWEEKMQKTNTYSNLKFLKKSDCEFSLEFIESDDDIKKNFSKKGDVYNYKIVGTTLNSLFLEIEMGKRKSYFELIKLK
ncbi:hypothetical protein RM697_03250 [Ichthyenterobacterium sp. W332]|uniref:Uncharacterized protein n=1 Tax=Microcosmobacter mediterraneus TaxID=3075607 RepID=A0ABU2YHK0_9FLAO|nr:hypothetical protein [Ichthyenterobacterium sp. W332]MDT0557645.1 hypothetical protein [Ichthyenterobacterium sp. W332]